MSSSDRAGSKPISRTTGRVFMGVDSPGPEESTLQDLEGKKRPVWDEAANTELIGRVKERAKAKAREIISKAMAEAEEIKENARSEGLAEGRDMAQAELDKTMRQLSDSVGQALSQVQDQAKKVWREQREDMIGLIRMAVEKITAVEMSEHREESLAELLEQALDMIEARRTLTVKVAPGDVEVMEHLVERAKENHEAIRQWRVRPDEAIAPGGMVIESDEGMVDSTLQGRMSEVEPLFEHLRAESRSRSGGEEDGEGEG